MVRPLRARVTPQLGVVSIYERLVQLAMLLVLPHAIRRVEQQPAGESIVLGARAVLLFQKAAARTATCSLSSRSVAALEMVA